MNKLMWSGVAAAVSLALTGAASAQIKIGVAGPITGSNATFGAQLKNGAEQAVEDINAGRHRRPEDRAGRSATTSAIRSRACRSPTSSSATA